MFGFLPAAPELGDGESAAATDPTMPSSAAAVISSDKQLWSKFRFIFLVSLLLFGLGCGGIVRLPGDSGNLRNILHPQCFDWNAKPLRGCGAFRKQRNMQWRMVSQHGVQFWVVGCGRARDVERRLDRRMGLKGEAAVQRDVKDEPEI